jgi:alkyl sulfatase BDS1-like metallo-beta-lactamase superfamily hydrolase
MVGLIAPTRAIEADLETLHIDGIEMVFQNTPNTESPSEMNTWFPQFKALWAAENVTATLHNIYTLRGAETRDALAWSKYINELIHHFAGEAEILFASHGWPRWGNQYLIEVLEKQRDLYGYLHNQTLHLANQGVNISNIHEVFTVPEALAQEWYNRGYHGAVSHNIRGVINKYLGFFDMNPATLNMHGTAARGERYVALAGGAEAILINAREAQQRGDYRWAAEVLSHLVFAEPNHTAARLLQADIFEQLGYQAENAGWRNLYLTGAQELRHGIPQNNNATQMGPDIISAIPTSLILDLLAVRMNAAAAEHKHLVIRLVLPDTDEQFLIELKNSNLSNIASIQGNPQVTVTINRQQLDALLLQQISMQELIASGAIQFDNNPNPFFELLGLLEEFPFYFNIITPLE